MVKSTRIGQTTFSRTRDRVMAAAAMTFMIAAVASAQTGSNAPQNTSPQQGTITPIESGFLIAPDAKFTEVNNRSATLIGGYGGWMTEHTILIGAAGYWLANNERGLEMAYGGGLVEWLVHGERKIAFGARGLIGGGNSTLSGTVADLFGARANQVIGATFGRNDRHGRPFPRDGRPVITPSSVVLVHDDYFIAEPQGIVSLRAYRWLHVDAGVGYRFIAGADTRNDRLSGLSGTVSVKFGGG